MLQIGHCFASQEQVVMGRRRRLAVAMLNKSVLMVRSADVGRAEKVHGSPSWLSICARSRVERLARRASVADNGS